MKMSNNSFNYWVKDRNKMLLNNNKVTRINMYDSE